MSLLKKSYHFAKRFNEDRDLRTKLFREGFMRQPPNLLKQESGSASVYVSILLRMFSDEGEERKASRAETEQALIPLCADIVNSYVELDEETQQRNIITWRPVVVDVLEGYTAFHTGDFERHATTFTPLAVGLMNRDMGPELQRAVQGLWARVTEIKFGVKTFTHSSKAMGMPSSIMARRSAVAAPKKSKAAPAATKTAPNKKAKKAAKNDSDTDPDPAPLDDSDNGIEPVEPFKATLTSKHDRMVRKIQCTIPDGTAAVKKKQRREFTQTIKLTSKKPFSLEPVRMINGQYAGLHVLVLRPEPDENEKFPFLDLPAEIRNMIYSLVLERPGYHLMLSGKHSGVIQTRWFKPGTGFISRHDDPYSTSVMRVNKQISVESMPYLFSRHTFEFTDSTMMQRFLEYIGPERIKSLISVVCNQQYAISFRKAYALLAPAVSLTKLEIDSMYTHSYYIRGNWPSVLSPLFQSLCAAGRSREDVFNMITLPGAVSGFCQKHGHFRTDSNKNCKKAAADYEEFYKKLRADFDKEVDKAEAKKAAIEKGSPVKTRSGRNTKAIDYSGMDE
ncbi:hypothetical protein E4T44_09932 [Aureobasidium sp. EXF-8845]|nr:hypothetical protein E4T44_09932 [Aureobasidium sp. EXF-8845]KAI4837569.1 hypothetical protein E4T45_09800 [Aureobasidium sp. EXF-8846]